MRNRQKLIWTVSFSLTALLMGEVMLRGLGYQPGVFRNLIGFRKTDSLVLYKNFETDSSGIYKFSKWVTDSLPKYYNIEKDEIENAEVEKALFIMEDEDYILQNFKRITTPEIFKSAYWRLIDFVSKENFDSPVKDSYSEILKMPPLPHDEWSTAVQDYLNHPFNQEGFRSIAFKKHNTKRKRVLLIGDSFVYGMSAKPYYNSFYDLLLSQGYMVYAAATPGTDPAQYAAIAEKYIPVLMPDLVLVCSFPANDIMSYARQPRLNEPPEHATNAGFISSNISGKYYTPDEAYRYYLSLITIPANGSIANTALSKSALGSLLWGALFKMKITSHPVENLDILYSNSLPEEKMRLTRTYFEAIRQTCKNYNATLANMVIPNATDAKNKNEKFVACDVLIEKELFDNNCFCNGSFELQKHFPENDYHFNDAGHQKYAGFLKSIIDTLPINKE